MRVALVDEDRMLTEVMESIVSRLGHDVVGIADTTPDAVNLVERGQPDVVVLDYALGFNTDFDVIRSAVAVGASVIVFSHTADADVLGRYSPRPTVVGKPDLYAFERELERVVAARTQRDVPVEDRRKRPARAAGGPVPTGLDDAQAFYEAVANAVPGDTLLSIELADAPPGYCADVAARVVTLIRSTDRLLASLSSMRVFLAGGTDEGVVSFVGRLRTNVPLPPETTVRSVVVADGELAVDAFDRLKREGRDHPVGQAESSSL